MAAGKTSDGRLVMRAQEARSSHSIRTLSCMDRLDQAYPQLRHREFNLSATNFNTSPLVIFIIPLN